MLETTTTLETIETCPHCDGPKKKRGTTCGARSCHSAQISASRRSGIAARNGDAEWTPTARYGYNQSYWDKNPDRRAAHIRATVLARGGQKSEFCNRCRVSGVRIENHHWSYAHPSDVEPLCTTCHALADRIRKLALKAGFTESQILKNGWKLEGMNTTYIDMMAIDAEHAQAVRKVKKLAKKRSRIFDRFAALVTRYRGRK